MKFTLSWLKEHLDTDASVDEIVKAMTLAGLEVEEVINPAEALKDFTIAKIVTAEKHPDADKLKVCKVETKDGDKIIVCGAPNARADMTVAYAGLGTYIPGPDFSLDKKPRKIRGVESFGMMCSAKELGLGDDDDGIMDLDAGFSVGMPLADALKIDDPVIDFEVTPNRPDWLGVDSIARELAAAGLGAVKTKPVQGVKGTGACVQNVRIQSTQACPAFAGRIVRGVKNGPSPKWLQDQLKAIGLRPISALVDITNFITYDRARPLHFYDRAKISGDIIVRYGQDETFEALDDKTYTAGEQDCAICDESGILGLGGIVGGESTGCDATTTEIFIESAYFDPLTIRKTAQRLGVNSDAKYRFERGVDTGFVLDGLEMATQMVLDICGGEASDIIIAGEIPAAPASVEFDPMLVTRLTGMTLSDDDVETILVKLGFTVKRGPLWTVDVPTWRRDVVEGADLVEDIVRIAGFDKLEAVSLPPLPGRREPTATLMQNRTRLARRALAMRGLSESVTWSFVLRDHARAFGGGTSAMIIDNPISSELDCMRPTALIHLLLSGQRNADRGYPSAALFEAGPVYRTTAPDGQDLCVAGMRRVETRRGWAGDVTPDALSAKADVQAALAAMGANIDNLQLSMPTGDYWHPGRSGRLQMGPKNILADFGELHPATLKSLGIEARIVAFEIWPQNLPVPRKKLVSKAKGALVLSDLMPVHKDFAFIVSEDTPCGDVIKAARGADKHFISDVTLFDIYRGQGVDTGHKSLAISVTLTPKDATMTDKDIEGVMAKIVTQVKKVGGTLRG